MRVGRSRLLQQRLALFVGVGVQLLAAQTASAQIVINEIEYDQPSVDAEEFIELKNVGSVPVGISGYVLNLINGANGGAASYTTISLPNFTIPPGGYFVVCGNAGLVPNCNFDTSPDTNLIQNGAPDAVALLWGGVIIDTLSYEGDVPGYTEGSGAPADDGSSSTGLSRCLDGIDTNNNGADFKVRPHSPGTQNNCAIVGGNVGACGSVATAISSVQGDGTASPKLGQTVVIEGVVVGDFQDDELNGFFVQEEDSQNDGNPATSEGIFVYEGALNVSVAPGSVVRVRGEVVEFNQLTELSSVTDVVVCPGFPAASPQTLTFPVSSVADLERYEGMLITIAQTLTVTGNFHLGRYGSLDLSAGGRRVTPTQVNLPGAGALAAQDLNNRSRIVLDDANTDQNPNPIPFKDANNTRRVGDTLPSLTGILDGRLGAYRVQPTTALAFSNNNPPHSSPDLVGGRLRVVSFNVLNYFTTIDTGAAVCGTSSWANRARWTTH